MDKGASQNLYLFCSAPFFLIEGREEKSVEAYTGFAAVYDMFMDDVPYEEWCEYVCSLLEEHEIRDGLVLDLGCGTGSMTELLAERGYDMIGIDYSEEMLELAAEKKVETDLNILYLCQDMREFELYGTVKAVISVCDCINYITDPEDLKTVFKLVNNYLDPGGIFIFDMNTEYKYETVMGDCTIAEDRDESSFIWENQYDAGEKINIYDLSIFVKEESGLYRKYQETHYQRAYSMEEIKDALKAGGMEFVAAYDAFTRNAPKDESERIYIVAREHGKGDPDRKQS